MKPKEKRFESIKILISEHKISNQYELQAMLEAKGIQVTQATLSRDIQQLNLIKVRDENGDSFYQISEMNIYSKEVVNSNIIPSIEFSDTLAVMKTNPGYAMGIASDIDRLITEEIMGTIAGDDTILIILRKDVSKDKILKALTRIIPSIREFKK